MVVLERWTWRDSRLAGALHAAAGSGLGLLAGVAVRTALGRGLPSTMAAAYLAVAGRELGDAATRVAAALEAEDVDGARRLLPALVGRDPNGLDEKEIVRAVVESVAENTVDAAVAPVLWAATAGAPGALGYRAVNTVDAMVGNQSARYRRYGWAGARLDDAAAWVPARVTAAAVAAVRPRSARAVWRSVREDAPGHPSPNGGVAEAAFAAALGLRLGGENRYGDRVEIRPPLGTGRPPELRDVAEAVRLSSDVGTAVAVLLVAIGLVGRRRR
jgi:adenosylcobinamide-phosphate synthase